MPLTAGETNPLTLLYCGGGHRARSIFQAGRRRPTPIRVARTKFIFRDNCISPCTSGYATVTKIEQGNVGQLLIDNLLITAIGQQTQWNLEFKHF